MIRFPMQDERLARHTQEPQRINLEFAPLIPQRLQKGAGAAISMDASLMVHAGGGGQRT
jgi:hypothetical protein